MNSTGYSDYNIRKQITLSPKIKVFFGGLPYEFYSISSIMGFSTQIIIFVTNKLTCQEQIYICYFGPAGIEKT